MKKTKQSSKKAKTSSRASQKSGKKSPAKKSGNKMKGSSMNAKSGESGTDIIELILRDHMPIKKMIETLKDSEASASEKREIFEQFAPALLAHAKAEEETLYTQLKSDDEMRVEGLEGDVEHQLASQLISELNEMDSEQEEDEWMAKVKVLAELVEHHVKEEESNVLKEVKKEFNSEDRMQIGQEYSLLMDEDSEMDHDEKRSTQPQQEQEQEEDYV